MPESSGTTFVCPATQPMPFTPASVAGFAHTPGSPHITAALAPPIAAERMEVSIRVEGDGGVKNCARAGPATTSTNAIAAQRRARGVRKARIRQAPRAGNLSRLYILGSVMPTCFWYFPALSL